MELTEEKGQGITRWHEKHKKKLFFFILFLSTFLMLLIMHPDWFQ